MSNSNKLQRKQTTQYRGHLAEVEVELQGMQGALSNSLALTKRERENNVFEDTNNLLDRVLMKENMKLAFKRVVANKGSHGVDKMRVDELQPFLKEHWHTIKQKLLEGTYNP